MGEQIRNESGDEMAPVRAPNNHCRARDASGLFESSSRPERIGGGVHFYGDQVVCDLTTTFAALTRLLAGRVKDNTKA